MPGPGGPMGGPGPMGGGMPPMGMGVGRGYNFTMGDANGMYDAHRTMGRPQPVSGAYGYVGSSSNDFSIFNLIGRIRTAKTIANSRYYRDRNISGFRAFIGSYRVLSHGNNRCAHFDANVNLQKNLLASHDITKKVYCTRIMGEAMNYYGYLKNNLWIGEEEYRNAILAFAEAHDIDFSFGDEAPVRGR